MCGAAARNTRITLEPADLRPAVLRLGRWLASFIHPIMLNPPVPQLAPLIRARLKQRIPALTDEDLPLFEMSERDLIDRIVRRTGDTPDAIRAILYQIGVFVPPRPSSVRESHPEQHEEESLGSGI